MIVKNESRIIERCLKSVIDYIDYWIIHDTGSTDDTCKIIKNFFDQRNIDGKLVEVEWKDFGTNRTKVVEQAINLLKHKNYYLLLLDADFEIRVSIKVRVVSIVKKW
jgi:glycosyltransferase involved in cell wall biosynthesis